MFPKQHKNKDKSKSIPDSDAVMSKPRHIIADAVAEETDPNGSYTGVPVNRHEEPVQDADDL